MSSVNTALRKKFLKWDKCIGLGEVFSVKGPCLFLRATQLPDPEIGMEGGPRIFFQMDAMGVVREQVFVSQHLHQLVTLCSQHETNPTAFVC